MHRQKLEIPEGGHILIMPGRPARITRERVRLGPGLCGWLEAAAFARLGLMVHISAPSGAGIDGQQVLEMSTSPAPLAVAGHADLSVHLPAHGW